MEKKLIVLIIIALLIGLGGGYGLGYSVYQPQDQNLQGAIDSLNAKVQTINSTLISTMSFVTSLQNELDILNSTVWEELSELQTRLDSLNATLIDFETSLKPDQPQFVILDALPEEQLSKVRVIVWNIGDRDAHDILISYNLTAIGDDWIKLIGNTTVPLLKAGEIGRIQVPWTVIRQVSNADVILHIEVSISCAEGVTKQDVVEHPNRQFGS